jgi:hypothetical protein
VTKSPKQILIEAKALIADPVNWCQGDFAQDSQGYGVNALSERAMCRCSLGAVGCAAGISPDNYSEKLKPIIDSLDVAAAELVKRDKKLDWDPSIVELNDGEESVTGMNPHQAVMAAFDLAIERTPA